MSRLVVEGDLHKNFGEFYPLPYIDYVKVKNFQAETGKQGYEFEVDFSLMFTVPEHDPNLPHLEEDLIREILSKINTNLVLKKVIQTFHPWTH